MQINQEHSIEAHVDLIKYLIGHKNTITSIQEKNPNIVFSSENNLITIQLNSVFNSDNTIMIVKDYLDSSRMVSQYLIEVPNEKINPILDILCEKNNTFNFRRYSGLLPNKLSGSKSIGIKDLDFLSESVQDSLKLLKSDIDIDNFMHTNFFQYDFPEYNLKFSTDSIYNPLSMIKVRYEFPHPIISNSIEFDYLIPAYQIDSFPIIKKAIIISQEFDSLLLLKKIISSGKDETMKNIVLSHELQHNIPLKTDVKKYKI